MERGKRPPPQEPRRSPGAPRPGCGRTMCLGSGPRETSSAVTHPRSDVGLATRAAAATTTPAAGPCHPPCVGHQPRGDGDGLSLGMDSPCLASPPGPSTGKGRDGVRPSPGSQLGMLAPARGPGQACGRGGRWHFSARREAESPSIKSPSRPRLSPDESRKGEATTQRPAGKRTGVLGVRGAQGCSTPGAQGTPARIPGSPASVLRGTGAGRGTDSGDAAHGAG